MQIQIGDFRELSKTIPDDSIDLILTDPPYADMDCYRDLARLAMRVLRPDSACLAFCGIGYLPETLDALREGGLSYRWRLIVRPVYAKEFHGKLCVMTQELLWFEKGRSRLYESLFDFQFATRKGNHSVNGKNWGKNLDVITRYILAFTRSDGLVYDPFLGSGTTAVATLQSGRRFIGHEIDEKAAIIAKRRLELTQPSFFTLPAERQLSFV